MPRRTKPAGRASVQIATVASLAWGALAFGATYIWASRPLMAGCALAGGLAWSVAGRTRANPSLPPASVFVAAIALAAAISIQLIPLPAWWLERLSPEGVQVVTQLNLAYMADPGWHPLSISPGATLHALALFLSFGLFLFGLTRYLSAVGVRWVVWGVTGLGVLLALLGLIQHATYNGRIYGFWTTQMGGSPFGPFVNRNHFAGWMLMALPLTIALMCSGIARGMVHVRPTLRDRLLWFGSRDASAIVVLGASAAVMALSLVLTMSRSGMLSFLLTIVVVGAFVVFGARTRTRKSVAGLYLAGLLLLVAAWAGVDAIAGRFAEIDQGDLRARPEAWADAWAIAGRFPLTGAGLNTYGVATLLFQEHQLGAHYVQAHNDYLQLLAEGGALLAIPAVALLAAFARAVRRRFTDDGQASLSSWWARAGAVTGLLAIGLQETVEFSLQMPGNAALFAVLCAIALHRSPKRREHQSI